MTQKLVFENSDQKSVLATFVSESIPKIIKETDYDELYGYQLTQSGDYFDKEIVDILAYKFLKANKFNSKAAYDQLKSTLEWRKTFNPLNAAFNEKHDTKFEKIGVLTNFNDEILTWNIYGSASKDKLFDDLEKFIRYRIGLMELGLQLLNFKENSYLGQVHDYDGVSFLRFDAKTKEASGAVIRLFQSYYPEFLSKKFFVNVPGVMTWIFDFLKKLLPTETTKKFTLLRSGKDLVKYLNYKKDLPKIYGGENTKELKELNVRVVKPTEYTSFLLQKQFTNELD